MKKEQSIEELVVKEEEKIARNDQGTKAVKKESLKFPVILLGAFIYSVGLNCFCGRYIFIPADLWVLRSCFRSFSQELVLTSAALTYPVFSIIL